MVDNLTDRVTNMNPKRIKDMTDEELMVRYQEDSVEAFDELYRRHSGRVLGYFRKRWGPHQIGSTPEDLLQVVFYKLHQGRPSYRKEFPFLPWLFSISHHVLIDAYRKEKKRDQLIEIFTEPSNEQSSKVDVWGELQTVLSPTEYRLLKMRFEEGLSFELLALKTGKASTALRKKVSRLLKKIRSEQLLGDRNE